MENQILTDFDLFPTLPSPESDIRSEAVLKGSRGCFKAIKTHRILPFFGSSKTLKMIAPPPITDF